MSKYSYIIVSTDKQTLENQKERLIEDLFLKLKDNDTLVVTEL